jgi:hypothetical protein
VVAGIGTGEFPVEDREQLGGTHRDSYYLYAVHKNEKPARRGQPPDRNGIRSEPVATPGAGKKELVSL